MIEWALKLAGEVSVPQDDRLKPELQTAARIVLITDACAKEAVKQAQESGVEVLRVGTAAGNLAITRFTARRSKAEPAKCEVLVEVQNQGNQPAEVTVKLLPSPSKRGPGGNSLASPSGRGGAKFPVAKDSSARHIFTLTLPSAARLTAKIEPGDSYPFDDAATLDLPAAPAGHRVKLVCDDQSSLKEVLAANQRVQLTGEANNVSGTLRVPEGGAPGVPNTIQVIDGKTPEKLPAGPALIFSPTACDLWQLGNAVTDPSVTRVDDDSPVTDGVWLLNACLPDARQLRISDSPGVTARPILWAGTVPLGYAIDRPQGRVVVIAGDLAAGNLPSHGAFSQLLDQALDWLDGQPPWLAGRVSNLSPPEPVAAGGPGESSPAEAKGPSTQVAEAKGSSRQVAEAKGSSRQVENLSYAADIRVPDNLSSEASAVAVERPWPPLWIGPAALAAALVIIEWCLYQRRWTS